MSLATQVAAIFSQSAVEGIDFHLAGFHVSAARLRKVGAAIACGRIPLAEHEGKGQLSAAYSPYTDKLTLPRNVNPAADKHKVAILHEGVHALVDIFGEGAGLTVLDDEVAAYLAEVIYYKALRRPLPGGASEKKIYETADELATRKRLYRKKGVKLSLDDVKKLREAIHAHPVYESIGVSAKTGGHGLKRKKCVAKARA